MADQDDLLLELRQQMARFGLTFQQQGELEGICARLIEQAARPDYRSWVPKQRKSPERSA